MKLKSRFIPVRFLFYLCVMKIKLLVVGRTDQDYLAEGVAVYEKRLKNYVSFEMPVIPALKNAKNLSVEEQKSREGDMILKSVDRSDVLILLDEQGTEYTSLEFSGLIQQQMNSGVKTVVVAVGGPFGFSEEVYKRSGRKISLSRMTFSHQMVRLFFVEQLYRAMTILRGEPYHHS